MTLNFSSEQVTKILTEVAKAEDGYNQVLQITIEALMRAEREEHLKATPTDKGNGYRNRKSFGSGKILELKVPRTRQGAFYPVLLSILKDQQAECQRLAYSLYSKGLTSMQVGDLFEEIYGKHYSKASVSNMMDFAREEVRSYLDRCLDDYYPIVYVDAIFIATRRDDSVTKEAFYTVLGVRHDRTREVLAVVNMPGESAGGWKGVFDDLKRRGVFKIGLLVSDGLTGIEDALAAVYSGTAHQLCVVHLERNILNQVKAGDKQAVAQGLKEVFTMYDPADSPKAGFARFKKFAAQWAKKYPAMQRMANNPRYELYFTFLRYHPAVRPMIYTTNWIERLNKDYRRVTRMRGALPNPEAVILLLGSVAVGRRNFERKIPKLNYEKTLFNWSE